MYMYNGSPKFIVLLKPKGRIHQCINGYFELCTLQVQMKLGTRVAMKGKPRIQVSSQLAWTLIILLIVQSSALKTGKFMFVWWLALIFCFCYLKIFARTHFC